MPYGATDITDFWRRWHISLSSWFRDYLFLPLGVRPLPQDARRTLRRHPRGRRHLRHRRSWRRSRCAASGMARAGPSSCGACSMERRSPFTAAGSSGAPSGLRASRACSGSAGECSRTSRRSASSWWGGFCSAPSLCNRVGVPRAHRRLGVLRHTDAVALHHPGLPRGARRPPADGQGQELGGRRSCGSRCPLRLLCYASLVFVLASFGATDAAPFIYSQFRRGFAQARERAIELPSLLCRRAIEGGEAAGASPPIHNHSTRATIREETAWVPSG